MTLLLNFLAAVVCTKKINANTKKKHTKISRLLCYIPLFLGIHYVFSVCLCVCVMCIRVSSSQTPIPFNVFSCSSILPQRKPTIVFPFCRAVFFFKLSIIIFFLSILFFLLLSVWQLSIWFFFLHFVSSCRFFLFFFYKNSFS